MNEFETEVFRQLSVYPPETLFLAAVSGGADSTAMLAALAAIREEKPFALRCLHVEHGIRPAAESRGDALAVKSLCKGLKVPCKVVYIPPGRIARAASNFNLGIEAAARFFRQQIWNRELRRFKAGLILTAHTRDDLLETMLMRFIRGSGPSGLASLGARSSTAGRGRILRPLLNLSRSDVISYLKEKGLSHCVDSTNSDLRYLRNRIRHRLVPLLDADFPFWRNALLFSGETQRLTADFLSFEAGRRLPWEESGLGLQIPLEAFFKEPAILREESFFQAVDKLEAGDWGRKTRFCKPPRRASLRRFLNELEKGGTAGDLGPVRAEKRSGYVFLKSACKPESSGGFSLLIKECGSYSLKDSLLVNVVKFEEAGFVQEPCFVARLPLVLRAEKGILAAGQKYQFSDMLKNSKGYAGDIIIAEDRFGIAALTGSSGGIPFLLYRREEGGPGCVGSRIPKDKAHLVELRGSNV